MKQANAAGETTALPRDLANFLVDLSIALHTYAIYPKGHPLLGAAQERLMRHLRAALLERETLSIGVARQQLIIEGVATDPKNPLVRELARRIHGHQLGAIKFFRGVGDDEVSEALRMLSAEYRTHAIGSRPGEIEQWNGVRLLPLTFQQLQLLEPSDDESDPRDEVELRAAQLWIGLARAALASDSSGDGDPATTDPQAVARAIDDHQREVAYDQVIVGYLLQIAEEVRDSGSPESSALKRRVSRLVQSLNLETLRQLLEMGGDVEQRRRFVLDAAQAMAVEAVVEVAQAAADVSSRPVSQSMMRLLNKLAQHAGHGAESVRRAADTALRDNVRSLVTGWSLADPNPEEYARALDRMSAARPTPPADESESAQAITEPERLIAMSLELGLLGDATFDAVDRMIESGRGAELVAIVGAGSAPDNELVTAQLWHRIASPDHLRCLLGAATLDLPLIEMLTARMGIAAVEPLIDALEIASERAVRSKLLDLVASVGPDAVPLLLGRLSSAPWFLQRNILLLFGRFGVVPEELHAGAFAGHADPRVRREAMKWLLRSPAARDAVIVSGLTDGDPVVVQLALSAAAEGCPVAAANALFSLLDGASLDPDQRAVALRAVARLATVPNAFPYLQREAVAGRGLFGSVRMAAKSPPMLAALHGMALHWRQDERAAPVLRAAAASRDPEIRAAVEIRGVA